MFFFVCGEHTFRKEVEGFEGMVFQCHHCGNMAGRVVKSNPWFTFCFVPVFPLSISGYKDVSCSICHFHQPLESRQDVIAMASGGGGGGGGGGGHPPPQQYGPPQGWGQQQYQQQSHPQAGAQRYG